MLYGKWTRVTAYWGLAALALWAGAAAVCPGSQCRVPALDQYLLNALFAAQVPWLNAFMAAATWLGSMAVLAPAALLLALVLRRTLPPADAWLPALSLGGVWLIAHATKIAIVRPRPALYLALIDMPADASFPSAHAMQVCAFALACVLIAGARHRAAMILAAVLFIFVAAVSRLYLQVHFPSDVMAGIAAAAGWVLGLHLLIRKSP